MKTGKGKGTKGAKGVKGTSRIAEMKAKMNECVFCFSHCILSLLERHCATRP